MSKEMGLIILGIFIAVLPYLGLPSDWKAVLFLVAGIIVALIGFLLRGAVIARSNVSAESHPQQTKKLAASDETTQ